MGKRAKDTDFSSIKRFPFLVEGWKEYKLNDFKRSSYQDNQDKGKATRWACSLNLPPHEYKNMPLFSGKTRSYAYGVSSE